jgi:hypothetical protein
LITGRTNQVFDCVAVTLVSVKSVVAVMGEAFRLTAAAPSVVR